VAHTTRSIDNISSLSRSGSILFDDWKGRIQMASDIDDIVHLMRAYLQGWAPEQLAHLPLVLASPNLDGSDTLVARAVIASRAELLFQGPPVAHALLREMALTLAAAASRLRYLRSFGNRF